MDIFGQIPTTISGWIVLLVVIVGAGIYLASRVRQEDLKTLRESNQDLRDAMKDMRNEMDEMKMKIAELENKNGTLYEIVSTAINKYFAENPEVVKEYKRMLQDMYQHNKELVYAKTK